MDTSDNQTNATGAPAAAPLSIEEFEAKVVAARTARRMAALKTLQPGDMVVASSPHMLHTVYFVVENPHGIDQLCSVAGEISLYDGTVSSVRVGGYASVELLAEQEVLRIIRATEGAI